MKGKSFDVYRVGANSMLYPSNLPTYQQLYDVFTNQHPLFLQPEYQVDQIQELTVNNFCIFQSATFYFASKLNIIVGENGTGKTQILKLLYSVLLSYTTKLSYGSTSRNAITENFKKMTPKILKGELKDLIRHGKSKFEMNLKFASKKFPKNFHIGISHNEIKKLQNTGYEKYQLMNIRPVFLPARDLLSIYPKFASFYDTYGDDLPFDQTYRDTIGALGVPYPNKIPESYEAVATLIEKAIGGKIYLAKDGSRFLLQMVHDSEQTEINLAAEGWRKLGEILQLLRNGYLAKGGFLFWDEPDSNLNPKLIRLIAQVIIELSKLDIQVFITTHSLFLFHELEILLAKENAFQDGEVSFFNFLPQGKVQQGNTASALKDVLLLDEAMNQADRYLSEDV